MDKIAAWLMTMENMASEVYARAAGYPWTNAKLTPFLKRLARDERWHHAIMVKAVRHFQAKPPKIQAIAVDRETREKIEKVFSSIASQLDDHTLSERQLLEYVAYAEFSEWNDVFLQVVEALKDDIVGFRGVAAKMRGHVRCIEAFLATNEFGGTLLAKANKVSPKGPERILIVDEEPAVCKMLKSIMRGEGGIDVAHDGQEGLRLLSKGCYKLIVTDVDLPLMEDGTSFYRKAIELFPATKGKFLFMNGDEAAESDRHSFSAPPIQ